MRKLCVFQGFKRKVKAALSSSSSSSSSDDMHDQRQFGKRATSIRPVNGYAKGLLLLTLVEALPATVDPVAPTTIGLIDQVNGSYTVPLHPLEKSEKNQEQQSSLEKSFDRKSKAS
ncbi:hypothetical protein T12_5664 [Trichinella patagoniensis]|uniref:Uncharacterized protein n=2 Tax=Trichinella TaxID=6333 RepID=A0A0V0ZDQ5_9BILA|nr:hypothetical protein T05_15148 [Trichinella murrelli]KRY10154.1 hypothetical protein T12_5664 [Trichinella patagoniensis]